MALQGSSFCYNGNDLDIRKLNSMPCSCIKNFGRHPCFSPPSPKQYNVVLATSTFQKGNDIQFSPRHCHLNMQKGRAMQHPLGNLPVYHAKGEDSEGIMSGESMILDKKTLERELQIAIEEENYAKAAKIRDNLRNMQEDSKASVLAANARFYNSFRNGDLATMQAIWAQGDDACCVHPGLGGISGYEYVMESWEAVWMNYDFPLEIELKDVKVHVRGDVGYVTCMELVRTKGSSWGKQFATNVFEKIDGQWFISIHHASHVDL